MKKYISKPCLSVSVLLFLFLSACGGGPSVSSGNQDPREKGAKTNEKWGNVNFTKFTETKSVLLFPHEDDESPRMSFSFSLTDTVPEDAGAPLGRLIRALLYEGEEPEKYADGLMASYKDRYIKTKNVLRQRSDIPRETLNWEYSESSRLETSRPRLLILSRSREYYLGGAHGMTEKKYFALDPEGVKAIGLEDIIERGMEPGLNKAVEDALRLYGGLKPGEPLSRGPFFEDTLETPDNFFLSPGGLGFHWDPYEIAPYAQGAVEVVIPYENIAELLSEEGRRLAGEF